MTAIAQENPTDLVELMKSHESCVSRWDVVVSYGEEKLNQLLRERYGRSELVTEVPIKTEGVSWDDSHYTIEVILKLGNPSMSFSHNESGKCILEMPIRDGSTFSFNNGKKSGTFPADVFYVYCELPVSCCSGHDTVETAPAGGTLIQFDEGQTTKVIFLNFKNESGTIIDIRKRTGAADHQVLDDPLIFIVPKLKEFFQKEVSFQYSLANISNQPPPDGATVLVPKSFIFTTSGNDKEGFLSIWIQAEGGNTVPGYVSPSFQPKNKHVLPVPIGYTASVIISYDIFIKKFIAPHVSTVPHMTMEAVQVEGLAFDIKLDDSVVKSLDSGSGWSQWFSDPLKFNCKDFPVRLTFDANKVSLKWDYQQRIGWGQNNAGAYSWGEVDVSMNIAKMFPINTTSSEITLKVDIQQSDIRTSVQAVPLKWYDTLSGGKEVVPAELGNITIDFPKFDLNFGSLNFFTTTNVLLPGQEVFIFDQASGVQFPHDILLCGHMAPVSPASKAIRLAHVKLKAATSNGVSVLITDMSMGRKVLGDVVRGLAFDYSLLDDVISKYNIKVEDIDRTLDSSKGPDPSAFRLWGALYEFSAPSWASGGRLEISPQTGAIAYNGSPIRRNLEILTANNIKFTDKDDHFWDLTFNSTFDSKGNVMPSTINGKVTKDHSIQDVIGAQLKGSVDVIDHWGMKWGLAVVACLGLNIFSICVYLNDRCKRKLDEQSRARLQAQEVVGGYRKLRQQDEPLDKHIIQHDVESEIKIFVNESSTVSDEIPDDRAKRLEPEVEKKVHQIVEKLVAEQLDNYAQRLSNDGVFTEQQIEEVTEKRKKELIEDIMEKVTSGTADLPSYLSSKTREAVFSQRAATCKSIKQEIEEAISRESVASKKARADADVKQKELENLDQSVSDEQERERRRHQLSKEIDDLTREVEQRSNAVEELKNKKESQQADIDEYEDRKKRESERAKERARDIYG